MTLRLFDQDPYRTAFEAQVLKLRQEGPFVLLNQTAFYPEGGGQPADRGQLGSARVLDVQQDEAGQIWHLVDSAPDVGAVVQGQIDWARRFDHMQQHAGEHVLAGCVHLLAQGFTHGLHIGQEQSSIDVSLPGGALRLPQETLDQIELLANERIQLDAPMRGWYPDKAELKTLTPRKPPGEHEHLRMVAAGDFELVACGGTHPASTGQIGLIKLTGCEPARGKMRLSFVCGMRAIRYLQALQQAASRAGALLSSSAEALPEAIERLQAELSQLKEQQKQQQRHAIQALAAALLRDAPPDAQGLRLIVHTLREGDAAQLRELAARLIAEEGVVALLALDAPAGCPVLFARHPAEAGDMAALLKNSGARGGGKPDFAQGSAPDAGVLQRAAALYADLIRE